MNFLEKNLEQIIFEAENELLNERGLYISGKKVRQLRIGNYGIADLVSFRREYKSVLRFDSNGQPYYEREPFLNISVFELKKDKIGVHTFFQAIKYCRGIERYFKSRNKSLKREYVITLVGKELDDVEGFVYLPEFFSSDTPYSVSQLSEVNLLTYDYKIDGLYFQDHTGYKLINEGFKL